ncbi:hypothetical protein [Hymenobacter antarcticus]|uniref:Uncharacterized protein n=1 Tax=Hymenobacter antarcticus TaxID=486270 RepID=A0ABP7QNC8_9BACT
MDTPNPEDKKGGRKRLSKAVYKRDPNAPDKAPMKPEELAYSKVFSLRFTQSEWESITTKAALGSVTPTVIVRAGALELELRAVLSRVWTLEERAEYRELVNATNYYMKKAERKDLEPEERRQMQELYVEMRRLLDTLVPARIEQKEDKS